MNWYDFLARRARRQARITATPQDVTEFVQRLACRQYDRYYQTITLPFDMTIQGYERTDDTWKHLIDTVDFQGKSVLDAGCYHGLIAFGAEDAGAAWVVGVDNNPDTIDTTAELATIWGYKTRLICADLDTWKPTRHFDIVICTNVIQHVKQPAAVIEKLFAAGDLVIWEAGVEFEPQLTSVATHRLVNVRETARTPDLGRKLYYFERK